MTELELATAALVGAGVVAGGLVLTGSRATAPERWYRLHWPRDVDPDDVRGWLHSVASDRGRSVIVLEATGRAGTVSHRLGLTDQRFLKLLRSFLPGLTAELSSDESFDQPAMTWQVRISSSHRPLLHSEPEQVSRAILTSLGAARSDETITVQWLLGPGLGPRPVASRQEATTEGWWDVVRTLWGGTTQLDADGQRALRDKIGQPGFRAAVRVGVTAATAPRARRLAASVLGALRTAEGPGVRLNFSRVQLDGLVDAVPPRRWPIKINVPELVGMLAWPLGDTAYSGVPRHSARRLQPSPSIPRVGRTIGESTYPGEERPLSLLPRDALHHLHVLGPTGVGKTTLLLNLITQDVAGGRGVVVIDPKGDLVDEVLTRIPASRFDDVVVLDPSDTERPVGLNPFRSVGQPAELVADQILTIFHELYRDNWGPRTQDILHACLLSLVGRPDMTLCALPVLLANPRFRRQVVSTLTDEIALKPFWQWYEQLSDAEREQAIAPVMNKLRAFLLRPRMRLVLGQASPSFNMRDVFTKRRVLLVSLAKGLLGPEAAALLGSLVVAQLWHVALGRVAIAPERRHPVMVFIDEFQDYLHLPTDLADVLAQARGLGVGLTLAHQHLAQLPTPVRAAVLANARSRVCFQLAADDAGLIARATTDLDAQDLQALGRYEAYAALVANGTVAPYASVRTRAPWAACSDPVTIREHSGRTYGQAAAEIEAAIAALVRGQPEATEGGSVGRRRRP